MRFNDRSMALLGIPDLPTDAFKHVGNYKIVPQGGGGSGGGGGAPAPTQTTVQNTNIPEYARPYVETMLGTAQQQLFNYTQDPNTGAMTPSGIKPYVPYSQNPSDYVAGFSPLQNQAMTAAGQMGTSPELDTASGISGLAASKAMGANYDPSQFNAQQVGTQDYTGANVNQYMNPYMQNVVDIQQREAQRQADIAGTQRAGQAVKSGAFGGSRAGLMEAEAARNLATQKGDIQAAGQNAAFQNAQQQFNAQQQRDLQAQLANQGANLTTQQMGEQSRQYGAGYGMQGLQTGLQAANQLGQLGQTRYGQQVGNIGLQNQMGGQQQNQQQNIINQAIQNYATAQQYPQQQLAFMSGLLRGLPLQTATTQQYQAAPSMVSQAAGLGMAGYGLSKMKKGGKVKDPQRPAGLAELALSKMA
jgi:hypothetical protein